MAEFVFTYRMPKGYQPGSPETMAAWTAWFQSMGKSVADIGKPVFERSSIGNTGGDTDLNGYSMIDADDLESALALAKGCPAVAVGGGVEVGELGDVSSLTQGTTN